MIRQSKHILRSLTLTETTQLRALVRYRCAPADQILRAKEILAIAEGARFTEAAAQVGRRNGESVAALVVRFNQEGLSAVSGHHGGGPALVYGPAEQARILQEFARPPEREKDQTATWSLSTLQRALRRAPDGLPQVSTYVILQVLHQAGYTWQQNRTWCDTGTVLRKRSRGVVRVTDPETTEKRGSSSRRTLSRSRRAFLSFVRMRRVPIKRFLTPERVGSWKETLRVILMNISAAEPPSY